MRVTVFRWLAMVGILCGGVVVLTIPFPTGTREAPARSPAEARWRTESVRRWATSRELTQSVQSHRAWQGVSRWRARGGGGVMIDGSVPAALRRVADSLARASLGSEDESEHAGIFVYYDSSSLPLASKYREASLTTVLYALPEVTDGVRCIAIVRLLRSSPAALAQVRAGPCAFYGVFGPPGARLRAWLDLTRFGLAREAAWHAVSAPNVENGRDLFSLPAGASACVTRGGLWCLETLGLYQRGQTPSTRDSTPLIGRPGYWLSQPPKWNGLIGLESAQDRIALGPGQERFLSDMARDLGAERFRAFWSSPDEPTSAFQAAAGMSLDEWTRHWLARTSAPVVTQARVPGANILWLVVALPLLLAGAVRRRELHGR